MRGCNEQLLRSQSPGLLCMLSCLVLVHHGEVLPFQLSKAPVMWLQIRTSGSINMSYCMQHGESCFRFAKIKAKHGAQEAE